MPANFKSSCGFTILEILLAVSLLPILSGIIYLVWWENTRGVARDAQRITDVNNIKLALEAFYEKNNKYPPVGAAYSSQTIFVSDTIPAGANAWIPEMVPEFILELPKDPRQTATPSFIYLYSVPTDRKTYNVWAQLENEKAPGIYTHPEAKCQASPPLGYNLNYCGEGF